MLGKFEKKILVCIEAKGNRTYNFLVYDRSSEFSKTSWCKKLDGHKIV